MDSVAKSADKINRAARRDVYLGAGEYLALDLSHLGRIDLAGADKAAEDSRSSADDIQAESCGGGGRRFVVVGRIAAAGHATGAAGSDD